ncbi:hypothetical protein ES288_A06G215000v1 [Gossypium darwinii]|uniref:Uncharacterized protein n=1 Tax=Gossypium darwinii TaxID=34276 RepID=A0A5D2G918_GOSDA|nr:hypothetical protein ES288_A06G215000v1 [Gossypium darwinii]
MLSFGFYSLIQYFLQISISFLAMFVSFLLLFFLLLQVFVRMMASTLALIRAPISARFRTRVMALMGATEMARFEKARRLGWLLCEFWNLSFAALKGAENPRVPKFESRFGPSGHIVYWV